MPGKKRAEGFKGTAKTHRVPPGVKGDLVPGSKLGDNLGTAIDFHIESAGLKEQGGAFDPVVTEPVRVLFLVDGADIEIGPSRQFGLFRLDGVLNHPPDDGGSGGIQAADHDEIVGKELGEGPDAFIGKVGIGNQAIKGQSGNREEGQFRIDGRGVGAELGHEIFRGQNGGVVCNLQGDSPHQNHDPDGIFLGLLDWDRAFNAENRVGEKILGPLHPSPSIKKFLKGFANFGIKIGTADLLGYRAVQGDQAICGDRASLGIKLSKRL